MFDFLTDAKEKILIGLLIALGSILFIVALLYYFERKELIQTRDTLAKQKSAYITAKNTIDELKATNDQNLKEFNELRDRHRKEIQLLTKKSNTDAKRIKELTKLHERIKYVKKEDDGAIAPVLYNTIERLQQLSTRPSDINSSRN